MTSIGIATKSLAGRRVVLLGGTGFIGRWVGRGLSRVGARVWMAARDRRAAVGIASDYAIDGAIVEVDVTNLADLTALFREARPAVTFNLAGYGVDRREQDPDLARAINVDLVARLLDLAPALADPTWRGIQLLHTGSALEYGAVGGHLTEDTEPNPTTVYGRTKLEATLAIDAAVAKGRLRAVTARLFTVYGPGEHQGRLLPTVLEARDSATPIAMTNGLQRRDFTFVGDVAAGLIRGATASLPPWSTANLATGRLHTVREFVAHASETLEIPADRFQFGALPNRPEEMAHDEVAVTRAMAWLDWIPDTDIRRGVGATAAFLKGLAHTPRAEQDPSEA